MSSHNKKKGDKSMREAGQPSKRDGSARSAKSAKTKMTQFDIKQDEIAVDELKTEIAQMQYEVDNFKMFSNSDERREEENFVYASKHLINDELWCKIVGLLGSFLIYGLLLVVRFLISIGLKGGLPSFEEVYSIFAWRKQVLRKISEVNDSSI